MGMFNYIHDKVEEFYKIADKNIGNFTNKNEFADFMLNHIDLLRGSDDYEYHIDDVISEIWHEKWSKYQ